MSKSLVGAGTPGNTPSVKSLWNEPVPSRIAQGAHRPFSDARHQNNDRCLELSGKSTGAATPLARRTVRTKKKWLHKVDGPRLRIRKSRRPNGKVRDDEIMTGVDHAAAQDRTHTMLSARQEWYALRKKSEERKTGADLDELR